MIKKIILLKEWHLRCYSISEITYCKNRDEIEKQCSGFNRFSIKNKYYCRQNCIQFNKEESY